MTKRIRMPILIVTAFWLYATASDILYANSMQAVLAAMKVSNFGAPWQPQALQHLFLYPVLLACVWASGRAGWQPFVRRFPLQVLLGIGFAGFAVPCLVLGDQIAGDLAAAPHLPVSSWAQATALEASIWLASITRFLLTYAFAIALVTSFEFYRKFRDAETHSSALQRALAAARLASLRMQLSPHSLFNLLHTLHGQIEWDPVAARALVVRLGDLLRRLLNASEREYWRLGEEMQFARLYLELQQKRFADRLQIRVPDCDALPMVWVPSLILQPLVENAVVHGMAGHHGAVTVGLDVTAAEDELWLRVVNTMAGQDKRSPGAAAGGIGLRNVSDRLAIHFGARASVRAAPGSAREWIAEIHLPLLFDVRVPPVF